MRNLLQLCLLGLALLALPAVVQAQFTFTTNNGAITITGYTGFNDVVTIPGTINDLPVTSIGDWAFYATRVTNVLIPDGVTNIGDGAFFDCQSLANVTLGSSVTSMGDWTFGFCPSLMSVCCRGNAPRLWGGSVFYGNLATIYYLSGTTGWGPTFDGHPAVLWNWAVPFNYTTNSGTITITGYTGSNVVVSIPGTINFLPVTSIGGGAFSSTNITSVTIPDSVTSVEDLAFYGCIKLVSLTIPRSITNIGAAAFNSCLSLTNIAIPASVTSIGDYAFFYCTNLTAIVVDAANPAYSSANGVLFNKDQTTLMQFPFGKGGSYSIPGSVTSLADEAFGMNDHGYPSFPGLLYSACAGLTNLTIPGSITNIGDFAFSHCTGLISVTLSNGIASIGDGAFSWCYQLASITIPGSITNIGKDAFYWSGLTNVTIEHGVSSIGERAFDNCLSLKSVIIPGSVTNIGDYAFFSCSGLINVNLSNGVSRLGADAFAGCVGLPHIEIPDSLTSIGQEAFSFCYALTNVTIPSSVTNIGPYAFAACLSLANIYVNADNAFYSSVDGILCSKDQTVLIQFSGTGRGDNYTVPSSITSIGSYSFGNNFYMGSYSVHSSGNSGNNLFPGTDSPGPYPLFPPPAGTNLVSVTIPGSVTNIGNEAFVFIQNLKGVYFAGNAPAITEDLVPLSFFGGPNGLSLGGSGSTVYYLPGTTGWDTTFGGRPTALWLPQAQTAAANFGGQTNQFGFNIQWASGQTVVVEACTNLANPDWQPVQTNTLTTGSAWFSDPQWTNYPGRYYRLRSP